MFVTMAVAILTMPTLPPILGARALGVQIGDLYVHLQLYLIQNFVVIKLNRVGGAPRFTN